MGLRIHNCYYLVSFLGWSSKVPWEIMPQGTTLCTPN